MSAGKKAHLVQSVNILAGQHWLGKQVAHWLAVILLTIFSECLLFFKWLWILCSEISDLLQAALERDLLHCLHTLASVPHSSYHVTRLPNWPSFPKCLMVTCQPGKSVTNAGNGFSQAMALREPEMPYGGNKGQFDLQDLMWFYSVTWSPLTFLTHLMPLIFLPVPSSHKSYFRPCKGTKDGYHIRAFVDFVDFVPATWKMFFILTFPHLACSFYSNISLVPS